MAPRRETVGEFDPTRGFTKLMFFHDIPNTAFVPIDIGVVVEDIMT